PLYLLVGASRNESRSEDLAKCWIVFRPADAREIDDRAVLLLGVRLSALEHAAGVTTVENQPRDAIRMADRIGNARRSALGDAEERDGLVEPRYVDHFLEIAG